MKTRFLSLGFRFSCGMLAACGFMAASLHAQVTLEADGPGDTYELISSVLGGNPIEVPDCGHESFGRHITEAWDNELGKYVFVFHIHVDEDDDRCTNFDRQRNEIKTYGPSPSYVKGFHGEVHTYRWKFKLDDGFQPAPSFTHIFQIKAGDGTDAGAPIITLTPRAGSPDRLQIIHTGSSGGGEVASTNLSDFKGEWVEAYVRSLYTDNGTIEIVLRRVSDGAVLLSWSSNDIDMWRDNATFNRPKWGIYRSLNHASTHLRDEQVRFADFCIAKGSDSCPSDVGDSLPSPWQTQDIGSVGATGSASHSGGTFTVTGAGADIWGSSDAFRYVFQPASADIDIRARVTDIDNTHDWAKAGVMIRETLNDNSRHAMVVATPESGVAFQRRTSTGGGSSNTGTSGDTPVWVRLVRSGDTFTGYSSSNGSSWNQIDSATISMSSQVYVGMPMTSHVQGTLGTATFTDASVAGAFSGYYRIMARHSGKAIVVESAGTDNGDNVFQWTYNASQNDEWEFIDVGDGYYRIMNRNSGRALVVESAGTENADNVFQWTYNASQNDEWAVEPVGGGYYRFVNRNSGKVLNVAGAGTDNGDNVDQWSWADVHQQQFEIISVQ